ncbi:MAG: catalase, partial [Tannerella sp.]|nr:catalase [Tannerella sp.]
SPETLHQVMILMSDRGLPANLRQQHGFGSHTFSFINKEGVRYWVKFHFKSQQGIATLTNAEAAEIVGKDREASQRDLFEHIEIGDFPRWKMCVQIMPEAEAKTYRFNPFDITKVWSQKDYPLIEVGILELNRNPENYYAEVEQAAFAPSHVVPGIGWSPDRLLQGRIFAYTDAQNYRLGVNGESLPVNAPKCPVHNYHHDGAMRFDGNHGGAVNYEPNSSGGPVEDKTLNEPPLLLEGDAFNYDHRSDKDYYTQPGDLYRLVPEDEKKHIASNVAEAMDGVPEDTRVRAIARFYQADERCGTDIAALLGIDISLIKEEVKCQQEE